MRIDKEFLILSEAAEMNRKDVICYVLGHNRDITILRDDLQRALIIAAARNYYDIGNELIKHGADVNFGACTTYCPENRENNTRPPIFNAVECGAYEFTEMLLSHGANPNVFEDHGYTPLVSAFYDNKSETERNMIINLLLENGADSFLGWREGTSFAEVYKYKNNKDIEDNIKHSYLSSNEEKTSEFKFFSLLGKIGLRKDNVIILPAYFTQLNYSGLPYATWVTHKNKYNGYEREVIILHEDVRNDADKMANIFDDYSSCADLWLFDEKLNLFKVNERKNSSIHEDVIRVFQNGMYYLFSNNRKKIISAAYSYIYEVLDQNVYLYRFGKYFGYLGKDGFVLTKPIFTWASDCIYKNYMSASIEYQKEDRYSISFNQHAKENTKVKIKKVSEANFLQILFRPIANLVYTIKYRNPEKEFRKWHEMDKKVSLRMRDHNI